MASLARLGSNYPFTNFANILNKKSAYLKNYQRALFQCSSFFNDVTIKIPCLSPTAGEGRIVRWLKDEGDIVNSGDVLCDIEFENKVTSIQTEEEGILANIFVPENSSFIKVGSLIARMVPQRAPYRGFHTSSWNRENGVATKLKMPSLSPTMTTGTIIKWVKKEGDTISPGDVLCEIETDKAVMAMETEEEGILAKIIVPEGTKDIQVGTLIALIVEEGADWQNVKVPNDTVQPEASASSSLPPPSLSPTQPPSSSDISSKSPATLVNMPSLSPTMTAGTIIKWMKKEGDAVSPGDVLCDIETDKAVMAMETEEEGILAKIIVSEGTKNVEVGTLIALIVDEGADWKSVTVPKVDGTKPVSSETASGASKEASKEGVSGAPKVSTVFTTKPFEEHPSFEGILCGPAAKNLILSYGLKPEDILAGSNDVKKKILKEDVLSYIEQHKLVKKSFIAKEKPPPVKESPQSVPSTKPVPESSSSLRKSSVPKYVDIELTNMRIVIAKRLSESKANIPHSYAYTKCNVNELLNERDSLTAEGIKISLNDFITKATGLALQIYPKANALVINNEVKLAKEIDVCVAVATDKGLLTPIIKDANLKNIQKISQEIRELAGKAKEGKLKPEEFQGGTFTISNLGMFGITHFSAIINPPQCGILSVGSTVQSLDVDLDILNHITLGLSYDRRAMEEKEAAEFMETLRYVIENPKLILVGTVRKSSVMSL